MELLIDDDVKAVAEFMQSNIPAAKLVSVASAIAALAPILWERFDAEGISALRLVSVNEPHAAQIKPAAISPASSEGVDGGFEAAVS